MERLIQRLKKAGVVGIDTPVFIYHFEANPAYSILTNQIFSSMEQGAWRGISSVMMLIEINVHPWRIGREDVARKYESLLVNFPNLDIISVDRDVARVAAQLRARFDIEPPDALHVAAGLVMEAKAFLTNDHRLSGLEKLIDILVLDDFV